MNHKKSNVEWQKPDECIACGALNSYHKEITESQKFIRGRGYQVTHHHWKCNSCQIAILGPHEMDEVMRATVRAYQKSHMLLQADQIRSARKRMFWSQSELSTKSGVSIATIKRVELGMIVQTPSINSALVEALGESLNRSFAFFVIEQSDPPSGIMTSIWEEKWDDLNINLQNISYRDNKISYQNQNLPFEGCPCPC